MEKEFVYHKILGKGEFINIEGQRVIVRFGNIDKKFELERFNQFFNHNIVEINNAINRLKKPNISCDKINLTSGIRTKPLLNSWEKNNKEFSVRRVVKNGKHIFKFHILLGGLKAVENKVQNSELMYSTRLYFHHNIFAELSVKLNNNFHGENIFDGPRARNKFVNVNLTKGMLEVYSRFHFTTDTLASISSDDGQHFIVNRKFIGNMFKMEFACFIPKGKLQYITPNTVFKKPAPRSFSGLTMIVSGGSCTPK